MPRGLLHRPAGHPAPRQQMQARQRDVLCGHSSCDHRFLETALFRQRFREQKPDDTFDPADGDLADALSAF